MTYAKQFLDIVKETLPDDARIVADGNAAFDSIVIVYAHNNFDNEKNRPVIALVANKIEFDRENNDPERIERMFRMKAENARKMYFNKLKALRG